VFIEFLDMAKNNSVERPNKYSKKAARSAPAKVRD
jgi:hypothetical protein